MDNPVRNTDLHGCEIACALKETFAQCKNFLEGTLSVCQFCTSCCGGGPYVVILGTCLFQMNYSLFVCHVFLLLYVFAHSWCLNITCTAMSLVCTVFMLAKWTVYEIEFAVYCYLVYRIFFFFFCFQHLLKNNSHILLVRVFYTIFRDTLTW